MHVETIEWKSVEEAMPERSVPVLISYRAAKHVYIAVWDGWWQDPDREDAPVIDPDFWAPLPKGPQ